MGLEGARPCYEGLYGPLARWRANLREHYSYLSLLIDPNVMTSHPEMAGWTDSQFIDELYNLQAKNYVKVGLVPASVYKAAIEHYSSIVLQSALNEADNHADDNVEKFGPRPILTSPDDVRSTHVLILVDSGSHIYNAHIKSPRNI